MHKEDVLYVCHRIPYPPNKGDKIRSFNILKHLASRYNVHLLTFIDDPEDEKYIGKLADYCVDYEVISIRPLFRKILSLLGVVVKTPLSNQFYRSRQAQQWIDKKIFKDHIKKVVLFSSPMAQFLVGKKYAHITRIMDFVDVDSEKWEQYAEQKKAPMSWLYAYEARQLRIFEKQVCREFDLSLFVSPQEAALFNKVLPGLANKVRSLSNGVDTEFFDPEIPMDNPYHSESVMVFTGAMDYWANVDAVCWFVDNCFADIRRQNPKAEFYIVGIRPSEKVKSLARIDGVTVTGAVKDIRPYVRYAKCIVAPLRIARGIQNKVLEALAMAGTVVASPEAMEGIASADQLPNVVADSPKIFTDKCIKALGSDTGEEDVADYRNFVVQNFSWQSHLRLLDEILVDGRGR